MHSSRIFIHLSFPHFISFCEKCKTFHKIPYFFASCFLRKFGKIHFFITDLWYDRIETRDEEYKNKAFTRRIQGGNYYEIYKNAWYRKRLCICELLQRNCERPVSGGEVCK